MLLYYGLCVCVDINECTSRMSDCISSAVCVDTDGSYVCNCPAGYHGDGKTSGSGCTCELY